MTKCNNCKGDCPNGTLENGLCSDCGLIGKTIRVDWARFGLQTCKVFRLSRNGTVYAGRWNAKQKDWTIPRKVNYYKGTWKLSVN